MQNRPPSYQFAVPGQQPGRQSPMPPPINTATQPAGYPPQQVLYGQPPAPNAPPGYSQQQGGYGGAPPAGYQPPQPQGPQSYNRPGAAVEVEAGGRSKAQLIVGIDFVCFVE